MTSSLDKYLLTIVRKRCFAILITLLSVFQLMAQQDTVPEVKISAAYIYDSASEEDSVWNGAIEFTIKNYNAPFIDLGYEVKTTPSLEGYFTTRYLLDENGEIPLNQEYLQGLTLSDVKGILIFNLPTGVDSVALKLNLPGNTYFEKLRLSKGALPKMAGLDPLDNLKAYSYWGMAHWHNIDQFLYYSIGDQTGIIDLNKKLFNCDTLNIQTMSCCSFGEKLWLARGYSKPRKFGTTTLYFGETKTIHDESTWKQIEDDQKVFFKYAIQKDDNFYLLSFRGVYKVEDGQIKIDSTFSDHRAEINIHRFIGKFELYDQSIAFILDTAVYRLKNKQWQRLYTFPQQYRHETSAVSLDSTGFFYQADRKVFFSDFEHSVQIMEKITNIAKISKGPGRSILFIQGYNQEGNIGGIYFVDTGKIVPLQMGNITIYPDKLFMDFIYKQSSDTLLLTSYPYIYEFTLEDWMRKYGEELPNRD